MQMALLLVQWDMLHINMHIAVQLMVDTALYICHVTRTVRYVAYQHAHCSTINGGHSSVYMSKQWVLFGVIAGICWRTSWARTRARQGAKIWGVYGWICQRCQRIEMWLYQYVTVQICDCTDMWLYRCVTVSIHIAINWNSACLWRCIVSHKPYDIIPHHTTP